MSKKAIDIIVYGVPSVTADSNVSDGTVPLEVFFSATAADQDGEIVKYEWDFDNDGTYDYESTISGNGHYIYNSAGTYAATVRVTDNDGYTATNSVTITVNLSPPMVTAGADLQEGNAPLTVNFTGSGSDADGIIMLYEWDFDGDGTYDFGSATTGDTAYTYNTVGTYAANCRVTDNDGLWSTDSVTITVNPTGTPSASLSAAPTEGVIPLEVTFSANGSDPDGTITLYEIDFDGDGTYDTSSASPITDFPHTYSTPGNYAATLRVTDNDGKQAFSSQNIMVFAQENSAFIWVVDRENHRVVKLSDSGDMLAIISGFYRPLAIDVDSRDGSVWVAEDEQGSNRVVKLSADIADGYNIETDNGSHLIATGFSGPRSVSVNQSDGSVWVADRYNNQVVKLTSDGTELARVSGFFYPYSVSVNSSDGTVWVADAINDQVVKLASDGNELLRIGGFNEPYSVSVDSSDGSVWVAAGQSHLVAKLASDGTEMWRAGGFNYPSSVSPLHQEENYIRYTLDTKSEITIWFSEFDNSIQTTGDTVRTLLFRKPQSAGTHAVVWDGTDEAGNLVPLEETYILGITAWRLPENAIIVNTAPVISNVFITPLYLNPDASPYDEEFQAKLSFDLSKNSDVRLSIYDSTNFLVRSFTINDVPAGFGNIITWDGKNDNGTYVAPGAYRVMAVATDANGYNSKPLNTPFIIIFY